MDINTCIAIYYVDPDGNIRHWAFGEVTELGTIQANLADLPALNTLYPSVATVVSPFGNRRVRITQEPQNKPQTVLDIKQAIEALASRLVAPIETVETIVNTLIFPVVE